MVMLPGEQPRQQTSLHARAAFDGQPDTTALARDFATDFLTRAQSSHGVLMSARWVDAVRLVVSELVTNASKYAPGPCLLELEITGVVLQISVWDTEAALPKARSHDAERIGQHGLEIVLALCQRLDVEQRADGKRVRAQIALA
jgi:anti-sigma regulatory factor (Ser/Thr protein kinase)